MKKTKHGLPRLFSALRYSLQGLKTAFQQEAAFRQELFLILFLTPLAIWLGSDPIEYVLLIGSTLLVLIVELINSSIEMTVDRISEAYHPKSEQAKDLASAAVFIALLVCIITWIAIILPKCL